MKENIMRLISLTLLLSSLLGMQASQAEGERFSSSAAPLIRMHLQQRVGSPPAFERPAIRPNNPSPHQMDNRPRFDSPHNDYSAGRGAHWRARYRTPFPSWSFYYDLTPPSNTTIIYSTPDTDDRIIEGASQLSPLEKSLVAQWAYREPSLYNIIPSRKLEQGWENSLNTGDTLSNATFSYAQALPPALMQQMPNGPQGTLLITLQGKLLRIWLRTQTVMDVYDLPNN
jgi:hypothetical protein